LEICNELQKLEHVGQLEKGITPVSKTFKNNNNHPLKGYWRIAMRSFQHIILYLILSVIIMAASGCNEETLLDNGEDTEEPCSFECDSWGLCILQADGSCRATSDAQCRASEDCEWWGLCHVRGGFCVALSSTDCKDSRGCGAYQVCNLQRYCCAPTYDEQGMCRCGAEFVWSCPGEGGHPTID
jgi:hypothetical protein